MSDVLRNCFNHVNHESDEEFYVGVALFTPVKHARNQRVTSPAYPQAWFEEDV